jgi:hypothetical protein
MRTKQLTDTLYGTTKDEDWHALGNGAYETTEFEKEDRGKEDMFGFDDGEELTDEEDETALGYYWSAQDKIWIGEHTEISGISALTNL